MNREFTISTGWKIFTAIFGLALLAAAIALFIAPMKSEQWGLLFFGVIILVVLTIMLLSAFKSRIIVSDASFTYVGIFKTNEIAIADIKGIRTGQKALIIESVIPGNKLTISNYSNYVDNKELIDWLKSNFTDLDAVEAESELKAVLNDTSLGYTEEDRKAKLERAKYIAIGYSIGGGVVALLGFLSLAKSSADSNMLFTLLALVYPLLGALVIATSQGLIKIVTKKTSPFYHIIIGVELPAIVLMAVGMSRGSILQYHNFLMLAAVVLLVFAALFYFADHAGNSKDFTSKIVVLLIFGAMYGAGAVASVNTAFDQSAEQQYSATVLNEYVHHGKSTSYNLRLSPWGPQPEEHTVSVSRSMYDQTPIGATVTIHLHKGFFNIPWYTVTQ